MSSGTEATGGWDAAAARPVEVDWSAEASTASRALNLAVRTSVKPSLTLALTAGETALRIGPRGIEQWRVWAKLLALTDAAGRLLPPPGGTTTEHVDLGGCAAEWVQAPGVSSPQRVVLYFHGGAYIVGGLASHRRFVAGLGAAADARVLNVGYRQLPRWPLEITIADGVAAYRHVLEDGIDSDRVVFAGDSAGGGLAFLVALAAREQGLPRPAGIVALSPWADLDAAGKRERPEAVGEPLPMLRLTAFVADALIAKGDPLDAELSPIHRDLSAFPPVLIHVGTTEVLQADAAVLAERLAAAGVTVSLKYWRGQIHDFQFFGSLVPEARMAVDEIGSFVKRLTPGPRDRS